MVAVVLGFEPLQHLRDADFEPIGHFPDGFGEIMFHLLLGDAAKAFVIGCQADVVRLVEAAEDAHLGSSGWLKPLKTLTCENLVTPVSSTNCKSASAPLKTE